MIRGVGIDVVEIGRIERMIGKYGDQFLCKVFTKGEIEYCNKMAFPSVHFAGRWAAKEAFYKALQAQFQQYSTWKSIEILPVEGERRPRIIICEPALKKIFKDEGVCSVHVSISHERSICTAIVIIE
ncbi:MAG: holo-ACP synthase [Fibrobacter sp.]|jgi:holo-[acyl-carrier protein] synthase|nr:holo-ACP synthase [Fibrobacter sp.]HON09655.1 holo-ACP synthase [Chitinispirillaceae bacterium]